MLYWGILAESWRLASRQRGLWPLALLRGLQSTVAAILVLWISAPLGLYLSLTLASARSAAVQEARFRVLSVLSHYLSAYTVVGVALFLIWIASAVLDVAAAGGLMTQVDAAEQGQTASAQTGLADGLRHWWRIAGLLALTAMPALVALLIRSAVLWVVVVPPTFHGALPNIAAVNQSLYSLSPLSSLANLITIPLAVLVEIALRFGVIWDMEWKPAFGEAWKLCRARLGQVAVMWLVWLLMIYAVWFASSIVIALIVVATIGIAIGVGVSGGLAVAWLVGGAGLALVLAALFLTTAVVAPVSSGVWTLFWRAATGRDTRFIAPVAPAPIRHPAEEIVR